MVDKIYAVLVSPNSGFPYDQRKIKKLIESIPEEYDIWTIMFEVTSVDIDKTQTHITIKNVGEFNSVHFVLLDDDEEEIDIF